MNWIFLIVAGLSETAFAFCMAKMSKLSSMEFCFWFVAFLVTMVISLTLLTKSLQTIPIGTAYPVWTGIGAVGTVLVGILFFKEPASFARLFFITTLIASIIGLKMAH